MSDTFEPTPSSAIEAMFVSLGRAGRRIRRLRAAITALPSAGAATLEPTERVVAIVDAARTDSQRAAYLAIDLSAEDLASAPRALVPGLVYLRERGARDNPFVWIDPWTGART